MHKSKATQTPAGRLVLTANVERTIRQFLTRLALWLVVLLAPVRFVAAQAQVPSSDASAPAAALADLPAAFITLGTNGGPILQVDRSEPANAVVVGNSIYLFDTGEGAGYQMLRSHLAVANLKAIFISHHHIDHNAGLAPILLMRWLSNLDGKLTVVGPPGTKNLLNGIASGYRVSEVARIAANGTPLPPIASTLAGVDLAPEMDKPTLVYADRNLRVLAITNNHLHFVQPAGEEPLARSYSYRIETAHRTFVFTGDTGPSPHLVTLAQGADVLVSEDSDVSRADAAARRVAKSPAEFDAAIQHFREDHLTPEEVGRIAEQAHVKEVILTHLSGARGGDKDFSGFTLGIDKYYHGPVHVANDLGRW